MGNNVCILKSLRYLKMIFKLRLQNIKNTLNKNWVTERIYYCTAILITDILNNNKIYVVDLCIYFIMKIFPSRFQILIIHSIDLILVYIYILFAIIQFCSATFPERQILTYFVKHVKTFLILFWRLYFPLSGSVCLFRKMKNRPSPPIFWS